MLLSATSLFHPAPLNDAFVAFSTHQDKELFLWIRNQSQPVLAS